MVYIGNICEAHKGLTENEIMELHFDNENVINILKTDELNKMNGDLEIIRTSNTCSVYVDTAFVKYMVIRKRFL